MLKGLEGGLMNSNISCEEQDLITINWRLLTHNIYKFNTLRHVEGRAHLLGSANTPRSFTQFQLTTFPFLTFQFLYRPSLASCDVELPVSDANEKMVINY